MTPYEVYFYSSGGVEEQWKPKDIGLNRANAIIGYALGGTLSFALMIVGGALFLGTGISPEHLGTIALGAGAAAREDRVAARARRASSSRSGGASIDTVFSGAYNLAQFCGWEWGRYRHPRGRAALRAHLARPARARDGHRHDRRRSGRAHRVRRDLLGRRAAAHLRADPARRERPRLHGPLRQRAARERARPRLPRRDRGRRADRDPADDPHERWARIDAQASSTSACTSSTTSCSTRTAGAAATSTTSRSRAARARRRKSSRSSSAPATGAQRAGWIGRLAGWIGGGAQGPRRLARGREGRLGRRAEEDRDRARARPRRRSPPSLSRARSRERADENALLAPASARSSPSRVGRSAAATT